jgi:hypothetical protein
MKKNIHTNNACRLLFWKTGGLLVALPCFLLTVPMGCEKENGYTGAPYFMIEGEPTGIVAPAVATTQAYTVRSNRPWKVVAKSDVTWARAYPDEGDLDGIFKIIVQKNNTFEPRSMNFAFVVNGEELSVLFRVDQEEAVPYLTVSPSSVSVPAGGGLVNINIDANMEWTYTVDDPSWQTEEALTETLIMLRIPNATGTRQTTLTVTPVAPEYAGLAASVLIKQTDAILEERFEWLHYGSAVTHNTTGEQRYDSWTPEERARGWTVTNISSSGVDQPAYARQEFVKLGRTNIGGDLISPKFSVIEGARDVEVSFKACAYVSAGANASGGGNVDLNELNIEVMGAGTITSVVKIGGQDGTPLGGREGLNDGALTATGAQFHIGNYPNTNAMEHGSTYNVWAPEFAERSFIITGATADTQIRFIGGPNIGTITGINRIFLDDIRVVLK